jgi:hypothetical protein
MQLVYDEIHNACKGVVDRLETLGRDMPPTSEELRRSVTTTINELTAATKRVVDTLAHAEQVIGRRMAEQLTKGIQRAIYDFRVAAQQYSATDLPEAVAKELGPQLTKAAEDGREALRTAKEELSCVRKDVSFQSKGNMILILIITIIAFVSGLGMGHLVYAGPDIGTADKATVLSDGLYLEELWPLLAPESRRQLIKIHDSGGTPKTK